MIERSRHRTRATALFFAAVQLVFWTVLCAGAAAQEPASPEAREAVVVELEKEISREYEALSLGNCAIACKALESMRRSAERLCALDPGPRCNDARTKVKDATDRVLSACPDCGINAEVTPEAPRAPSPAAAPGADAEGPPSEAPGTGGCAGCTVGGPTGGAGAAALAAAWVLAAWMRRRRGRRPPGRT